MGGLITGAGNQLPYSTDIARGVVPNMSAVHKFGHNHIVGTTFENLWNTGGMYVYPPSATIMTVSSDDANDTIAGTGARTLCIEGLDANYNEISDEVDLNGLTAVNTNLAFLRVLKMFVLTAGTTSSTAGNVGELFIGVGTVTLGVPTTIYATIDTTDNQTSHGFYTIPAGMTGYVHEWQVSSDSQKATEVQFRVRSPGGVFQQKGSLHLFSGVSGIVYKFPEVIPEKSDIDMRCRVDVGSTSIECFWDIERRMNGT